MSKGENYEQRYVFEGDSSICENNCQCGTVLQPGKGKLLDRRVFEGAGLSGHSRQPDGYKGGWIKNAGSHADHRCPQQSPFDLADGLDLI